MNGDTLIPGGGGLLDPNGFDSLYNASDLPYDPSTLNQLRGRLQYADGVPVAQHLFSLIEGVQDKRDIGTLINKPGLVPNFQTDSNDDKVYYAPEDAGVGDTSEPGKLSANKSTAKVSLAGFTVDSLTIALILGGGFVAWLLFR